MALLTRQRSLRNRVDLDCLSLTPGGTKNQERDCRSGVDGKKAMSLRLTRARNRRDDAPACSARMLDELLRRERRILH